MFDFTELLNCFSKVLIQWAESEGGKKDERKAPGIQRKLFIAGISTVTFKQRKK